MLMGSFTFSKWLVDGHAIPAASRVNLFYGAKPRISTLFQFETVEQFHFVKKILEDLRFCTLNEKHLRVVKRGMEVAV